MNTPSIPSVDALLSARLFLAPQLVGDRIYFISDLSGRFSLYVMERGGSVPRPLIPPGIALQHPHHQPGHAFYVFEALGQIVLMIDQDGDENYLPHRVPIEGGLPEPLFGARFAGRQVGLADALPERGMALFSVDYRDEARIESFLVSLEEEELVSLGESPYGSYPTGNDDYSQFLLGEGYGLGDAVLFQSRPGQTRRPLYGTPLEAREPGAPVAKEAISGAAFTTGGEVLIVTSRFDDQFGLALFPLDAPERVRPVQVSGTVHSGVGEMTTLEPLRGHPGRYLLGYNIDGASYDYAGRLERDESRFVVEQVLVGQGELADGVLESIHHDPASGDYVLAFSTATSPVQIYLIEAESGRIEKVTDERVLGIPRDWLAPGEDASFTSHDGLRVSARLYRPAAALGYEGPRPVIYYIHGGPQSQERPDFTWFSMPLIQYFTLNGFAVFVPNVRGSTGYGLEYMLHVQRDWGGQDRLDHVEAVRRLREDPALDGTRIGVMGRSYGGYMTLTLLGRHPELWGAGVDLFGPYNLLTFVDRLPETWKTFFYLALGHPETDREFLIERSPSSYLSALDCPLLVIQGANDPRVVERESRDVVETLAAEGKEVEIIVFEDEGHDVLKYPNKVYCFEEIVAFFRTHLGEGREGAASPEGTLSQGG